jgi:hypothetical protein
MILYNSQYIIFKSLSALALGITTKLRILVCAFQYMATGQLLGRGVCLHLLTSFYICLHLLTYVDICLHLFTYVYICLHLFTSVYICLHLFTSVYICLHLFTSVFICLHLFTSVKMISNYLLSSLKKKKNQIFFGVAQCIFWPIFVRFLFSAK